MDIIFRPGDTAPMGSKSMHVVYFLSGGTFQGTFKDGKTETTRYKTGETAIIQEVRPYATKDAGKTTMHGIYVWLK
jgi:hypothetical protein